MEIIVVADKQASKYLSNRENLSTVDGRSVAIRDIVEGFIDMEPLVWVKGRWVFPSPEVSPDILIHNQQITNKAEAEALLSCLKDGVGRGAGSVGFRGRGSYDTIIVGCDPDVAAGCLVTELEKYFGYEDVTLVSTPLGAGGPPDPRLRDKVNKLLYSETVEEAYATGAGGVGKVVVVVDEQASGFLSNSWNYGASDVADIVIRDIAVPIKVSGLKGEGRLFWDGKRWRDVYPRVVVHDRQVTKILEVPGIIGRLLLEEYETAVIGCDPDVAPHFTRRLREVFESENVIEIYPHLGKGFEEYKDLSDRLKELLDQTGVKRSNKTAVTAEGSEGSEDSKKERTLHLKVTLTNTNDPGSTPKTIDVLYNEGTNIELDLRDTTKDTA